MHCINMGDYMYFATGHTNRTVHLMLSSIHHQNNRCERMAFSMDLEQVEQGLTTPTTDEIENSKPSGMSALSLDTNRVALAAAFYSNLSNLQNQRRDGSGGSLRDRTRSSGEERRDKQKKSKKKKTKSESGAGRVNSKKKKSTSPLMTHLDSLGRAESKEAQLPHNEVDSVWGDEATQWDEDDQSKATLLQMSKPQSTICRHFSSQSTASTTATHAAQSSSSWDPYSERSTASKPIPLAIPNQQSTQLQGPSLELLDVDIENKVLFLDCTVLQGECSNQQKLPTCNDDNISSSSSAEKSVQKSSNIRRVITLAVVTLIMMILVCAVIGAIVYFALIKKDKNE